MVGGGGEAVCCWGAGRAVCREGVISGFPLCLGVCDERGVGEPVGARAEGRWGRLLAAGSPQGQLSLLGVCPPPPGRPPAQEFENAEGDDYVTELSAQGSPAPQHGPEVYVLPLTKVSLPMAKQPGRSGKSGGGRRLSVPDPQPRAPWLGVLHQRAVG